MADAEKQSVVDAAQVRKFHAKDDVDAAVYSHHHTLGSKPNQASPGAHTHDGFSSAAIPLANLPKPLAGVTISGAKGGNTALASVIAALVGLGATDITT